MHAWRAYYGQGRLDRAGVSRMDSAWIRELFLKRETRFVPLWNNHTLIAGLREGHGRPEALTPSRERAGILLEGAEHVTFLGLDGETAIFAVDISSLEEARASEIVKDGAFVELRRAGLLLSASDAAMLAYARAMLHWHRGHRFCGRCGHPNESHHGGHMRRCANPSCGQATFPRTDPAVIMLVEHRPPDGGAPCCLLGRHRRSPPGAWSTLAGFVEPGETLEEAVAREVFEEAGVRVEAVRYQACQPWPFPSSIMIGFRAKAVTTEIRVDPEELAEAGWFTAEKVMSAGEWGDPEASFKLSPRDSIARYLIEAWATEIIDAAESE